MGSVFALRLNSARFLALMDLDHPVQVTRLFTTLADGQRQAIFDFYFREGPDSAWQPVGQVQWDALPASPAGEPTLELSLIPGREDGLLLRLKERSSGATRSYSVRLPAFRRPAFRRPPPPVAALARAAPPAPTAPAAPSASAASPVAFAAVAPVAPVDARTDEADHTAPAAARADKAGRSAPVAARADAAVARPVLIAPAAPARRPFRLKAVAVVAAAAALAGAALALFRFTPLRELLPAGQAAPAGGGGGTVQRPAAAAVKAPEPQPVRPEPQPVRPQPVRSEPVPERPQQQPVQEGPALSHRVQWGDTLWRITERYYGNPHLYDLLAGENALSDPDLLITGTELRLPSRIDDQDRKQ
jgi:nucleoid-associated protein YgaU